MFKGMKTETKVGIFALVCIVIIVYATIQVSDRSVVVGGGYKVHVTMDSAVGIKTKTPVEISGIQVGVVKSIKLDKTGKASVTLLISKGVKLPEGTMAHVRAKGFLGETYIELRIGPMENNAVAGGGTIPYGGIVGDMNMLMGQFGEIANDIKSVTSALKTMVGPDEGSPVYRTVHNLDKFTETLKEITVKNEASLNQVINNLAILTNDLREVISNRRYDIDKTMTNLSNITTKIDEGQGTIGRLVNDDATVNKLDNAVDNLSDALGGLRKLETQIGYHMEYLTGTTDFKHYVHLNLLPTPDKAFMLEFISDPSSSPIRVTTDTAITAGGTTSNVTTHSASVNENRFLFSAQMAKKFYDLTLRGGLIESTGGVGADYTRGPVGLHFSAFDFSTKYGEKPHLKAMGNVNITKALYVVGGADDFINPNQPVDWFFGAGIRLVDNDIKSLLGLGASAFK